MDSNTNGISVHEVVKATLLILKVCLHKNMNHRNVQYLTSALFGPIIPNRYCTFSFENLSITTDHTKQSQTPADPVVLSSLVGLKVNCLVPWPEYDSAGQCMAGSEYEYSMHSEENFD